MNDETFVTTTSEALNVPVPEALAQLDSTFNVAAALPTPTTAKKDSLPHDSIMTEDISLAVETEKNIEIIVKQEPRDSPPRKPIKTKAMTASAKKAHEIFK